MEKKKLVTCVLHNIDIAVVPECLCHLRAQYLVQWFPTFSGSWATLTIWLKTVDPLNKTLFRDVWFICRKQFLT